MEIVFGSRISKAHSQPSKCFVKGYLRCLLLLSTVFLILPYESEAFFCQSHPPQHQILQSFVNQKRILFCPAFQKHQLRSFPTALEPLVLIVSTGQAKFC